MIPTGVYRRGYYSRKYASMAVYPWAEHEARERADWIVENGKTYSDIARHFGILWWVPGVLHCMEGEYDFDLHLANGDSLDDDTIHVPKGIMAKHRPELLPPFEFKDAAIAAIEEYASGWGMPSISTAASAMQFFEQWNGLGEWKINPNPGIPYLFSGTDQYEKGKFKSDGHWDADFVSQQVGAAVIMKALGI